MNEKILLEKLQRIFYECKKHIQRLEEASQDLQNFMPLDEDKYISLTKDQVRSLDQLIFRFSKLQDAIGKKLFKLLLILKDGDFEEVNEMSFIDILNKLEKYNILKASTWKILRDIKNELSHNYEEEPKEMSEVINQVYLYKKELLNIYKNLENFYKQLKTKV